MRSSFMITCFVSGAFALNAQQGYDYFTGNNVKALISPTGNHFWDFDQGHFHVPADSPSVSIFTSTFWIGGLDEGDALHLAAERYRQFGFDYTPGPVSDSTAYELPNNGAWDRVWVVSRQEIQDWLSNPWVNAVPQVVLEWPAHGNTGLGQAANLAPFVDMDNDGVYDPVNDFDYPDIRGDQSVYFIFNDDATIHSESGGQRMRVEIHGMAYGFDCPEDTALNDALFMRYHVFNRSDENYHDVYAGSWTDFDLGCAYDDFVACDPLRNLYYVYNGDNLDENAGGLINYGSNIPAQGIRIVNGVHMDDDGLDNIPTLDTLGNYSGFGMDDGTIDNERLGLSYVMYHNNAQGAIGDPGIAADYYNFMRGRFKDGTPLTFGNSGYNPMDSNAIPARFMYPDSADTIHYATFGVEPPEQQFWPDELSGDRRMMGSMGPFTLEAGTSVDFTMAFVFAQKHHDRLGARNKMKEYSDHLQALFDSGTTPCGDFVPEITLGTGETQVQRPSVYPNPARENIMVRNLRGMARMDVVNMSGQLVMSSTVHERSPRVDVGSLASGVYLVKLFYGNDSFTEKLVVE